MKTKQQKARIYIVTVKDYETGAEREFYSLAFDSIEAENLCLKTMKKTECFFKCKADKGLKFEKSVFASVKM